ncbi:hypothetical protein DPMN_009678 [Dreissena polymorpha]|uniref:Uncharacterized protein n=1 Tax=Dreissena polymorpha TaxID=45954 RepID=A0A9D4N0L5_DREPO|nr:hypothetical protein DPMN_009678 [Dreissena polymorpha]
MSRVHASSILLNRKCSPYTGLVFPVEPADLSDQLCPRFSERCVDWCPADVCGRQRLLWGIRADTQ